MNRRDFSQWMAALGGVAAVQGLQAQGGPVEGVHYVKLSQPAPVSAPTSKIEVLEFFWYACPHCYAFESVLEAWVKQLPPTVEFRPVHVFFGERTRNHQRLYYTLQAMGVESRMRPAIFKAIHEQGNMLDTPEAAVAAALAGSSTA